MNSILKPLTALDQNNFDQFYAAVYQVDGSQLSSPTKEENLQPGNAARKLKAFSSFEDEVATPSREDTVPIFSDGSVDLEKVNEEPERTGSISGKRTCGHDMTELEEEIKVLNAVLKPLTNLESGLFDQINEAVFSPQKDCDVMQPLMKIPQWEQLSEDHDMPMQGVQASTDRTHGRKTTGRFPVFGQTCYQLTGRRDSQSGSSVFCDSEYMNLGNENVEEISCALPQMSETLGTPLLIKTPANNDQNDRQPSRSDEHLVVTLTARDFHTAACHGKKHPPICRSHKNWIKNGWIMHHSNGFLSWMASLGERSIGEGLRRIVSWSPTPCWRANSHKLKSSDAHEMSEVDELNAVLHKINEVFLSMEKTRVDRRNKLMMNGDKAIRRHRR